MYVYLDPNPNPNPNPSPSPKKNMYTHIMTPGESRTIGTIYYSAVFPGLDAYCTGSCTTYQGDRCRYSSVGVSAQQAAQDTQTVPIRAGMARYRPPREVMPLFRSALYRKKNRREGTAV